MQPDHFTVMDAKEHAGYLTITDIAARLPQTLISLHLAGDRHADRPTKFDLLQRLTNDLAIII